MKVGPYDVHLVGGKVASVSLNLTPDQPSVTVKGQVVTPKSPEDLARHLGTCGPLQMNIGGNVIQCASGAIAGQHLGGLEHPRHRPEPRRRRPHLRRLPRPGRGGQQARHRGRPDLLRGHPRAHPGRAPARRPGPPGLQHLPGQAPTRAPRW
ncbi:MAG: hypothetical protein R3F43_14410 [bacterium]